eukprot:m.107646 g.107646  ORF g.107646 m.107646 type:complete len:1115 (-) comp9178_c0_seq3:124-3468(-)
MGLSSVRKGSNSSEFSESLPRLGNTTKSIEEYNQFDENEEPEEPDEKTKLVEWEDIYEKFIAICQGAPFVDDIVSSALELAPTNLRSASTSDYVCAILSSSSLSTLMASCARIESRNEESGRRGNNKARLDLLNNLLLSITPLCVMHGSEWSVHVDVDIIFLILDNREWWTASTARSCAALKKLFQSRWSHSKAIVSLLAVQQSVLERNMIFTCMDLLKSICAQSSRDPTLLHIRVSTLCEVISNLFPSRIYVNKFLDSDPSETHLSVFVQQVIQLQDDLVSTVVIEDGDAIISCLLTNASSAAPLFVLDQLCFSPVVKKILLEQQTQLIKQMKAVLCLQNSFKQILCLHFILSLLHENKDERLVHSQADSLSHENNSDKVPDRGEKNVIGSVILAPLATSILSCLKHTITIMSATLYIHGEPKIAPTSNALDILSVVSMCCASLLQMRQHLTKEEDLALAEILSSASFLSLVLHGLRVLVAANPSDGESHGEKTQVASTFMMLRGALFLRHSPSFKPSAAKRPNTTPSPADGVLITKPQTPVQDDSHAIQGAVMMEMSVSRFLNDDLSQRVLDPIFMLLDVYSHPSNKHPLYLNNQQKQFTALWNLSYQFYGALLNLPPVILSGLLSPHSLEIQTRDNGDVGIVVGVSYVSWLGLSACVHVIKHGLSVNDDISLRFLRDHNFADYNVFGITQQQQHVKKLPCDEDDDNNTTFNNDEDDDGNSDIVVGLDESTDSVSIPQLDMSVSSVIEGSFINFFGTFQTTMRMLLHCNEYDLHTHISSSSFVVFLQEAVGCIFSLLTINSILDDVINKCIQTKIIQDLLHLSLLFQHPKRVFTALTGLCVHVGNLSDDCALQFVRVVVALDDDHDLKHLPLMSTEDTLTSHILQCLLVHVPEDLVVDTLQLFGKIAKKSADYYPLLNTVFILQRSLVHITHNESPRPKAATCSLYGNLLRHSPYFYAVFQDYPYAIEAIVDCLRDEDQSVRKFSAFAIGNLAFHSDMFYPQLKAAIEPLVVLLGDQSERCKANAAAALGNLCRNGPSLDVDLSHHNTAKKLLKCLSQATSSQTIQVVLFSLGNLAKLPLNNAQMKRKEIGKLAFKDSLAKKYFNRLLSKLK